MNHLKNLESNLQAASHRFRVCKNDRPIFWDDFEKESALKLLKKIYHRSFKSIFLAPCKKGGLLIQELKLLWPNAQIDCLNISKDHNMYRANSDSQIHWIHGSLESGMLPKLYDLILVPEGFNTVMNHSKVLDQWMNHLSVNGTLAFASLANLQSTILKPFYQSMEGITWTGGVATILENAKYLSLCSEEYIAGHMRPRLSDVRISDDTEVYQVEHPAEIQRMFEKIGIANFLERGTSSDRSPILRRLWMKYTDYFILHNLNPQSGYIDFPISRVYVEGMKS